MDTLSYQQLLRWLVNTNGMIIVGLHCLVDARARKTNNPYGTITKRVRTVGFVGADYGLAVNREALRQGASPVFQSDPLPWGEWLIPHKVITHNGKLYLRTQTIPGNRRKQPAKVVAYYSTLHPTRTLTREQVQPWLPAPTESRKQSAIGLVSHSRFTDDTHNQVWVRIYAFDSIRKIRINGNTYKLVAD